MLLSLLLFTISVVVLTISLKDKDASKGYTAIWAFSTGVNLMGVLTHIARGL